MSNTIGKVAETLLKKKCVQANKKLEIQYEDTKHEQVATIRRISLSTREAILRC